MFAETTITVKKQKDDSGEEKEQTKDGMLLCLISGLANSLSAFNHVNSRSQLCLLRGRGQRKNI